MSSSENGVPDEPRDPLDVLAEQFLAQVRGGEPVTPEGFAARHPEHGSGLRDLCETLLMLEGMKRDRESSATGGKRLVVPQLERLGDYRIVREVGRGGMGVVFEAVQESLDRRVALKVLPQASLLSGNQLERFRREAQTAARLHHTHIVPVFDSGEADGLHFYAMQFIDGEGLDAVVKALRKQEAATGPAALRERFRLAARLGADVADALHHAHEHGALHRDVKPANLLLDRDGHVWVTDFGLAKALEQNGLTHTGDVLGTLQYMAPEQFEGRYDARSEVYALGATLYELASIRPAFVADSRAELIDAIRAGKCPTLRRSLPGAPEDLETVLARAMATDPARRYATAAEFASDLRAFLEDRPIAARRQSGLELLASWCRRNRALAASAAVAAIAVATAAVVGWGAYWTTREALEQAQESELAARASESVARLASERDRANLTDSLQVFEDVFDTIVGPDPLDALLEDAEEGGATVPAMSAPVDAKSLALLERMLDFYDKFAERNRDNVALRQQTARSYARVGAIRQRLGQPEEAVAAYEHAASLLREIADPAQKGELAALLQELGQAHVRRGLPRLAADCYAESLTLLGSLESAAGRHERWLRARAHYLLATAPGFREGRWDSGRMGSGPLRGGPEERQGPGRRGGMREGRSDSMRRPPSEADAPPGSPRAAGGSLWGEMLRQQSKGHLDAALLELEQVLQEAPADAEAILLKARCLAELSRHAFPQAAGGTDPGTAAVELLRQLVAAHPDVLAYRFELCEALLPRQRGRGGSSPSPTVVEMQNLDEAVGMARRLVSENAQHVEYQAALARALSFQGARRHELGAQQNPRSGQQELEEALAIHRSIATSRSSPDRRFLLEQVMTMRRLVRVLFDVGDLDAARKLARELVASLGDAVRDGVLPPRGDERLGDLPQLLERLGMQDALRELRDADRRRR